MDSEKTVVVKLKKVVNLLDRFMGEVKSDIDKEVGDTKNISAIQGRIILYLYMKEKKGAILQKDIETLLNIRSSTAAIILGRMEKNGLITREISSEDIRKKRKTVSLTGKARKIHPQALAKIKHAERIVTTGITKEEINSLFRTLDKITRNIS